MFHTESRSFINIINIAENNQFCTSVLPVTDLLGKSKVSDFQMTFLKMQMLKTKIIEKYLLQIDLSIFFFSYFWFIASLRAIEEVMVSNIVAVQKSSHSLTNTVVQLSYNIRN